MLVNMGFSTSVLNVIGHSWGGVITGELAGAFPGGVNRAVAIDPAEDAPPPIGKLYSTENVVFGGANSGYSWSFYSRDGGSLGITAGSDVTPETADEGFVVTGSEHSRVVDLFRLMISDPTGPVSRFFSLERLLAGTSGPWVRDVYESDATTDPDGLYEAVVSSTDLISRPTSITYDPSGGAIAGPGDYDGDGVVTAADYTVWRDHLGSTPAPFRDADGDGTGTVAAADYNLWKANFGATYGSGSAAVVSIEIEVSAGAAATIPTDLTPMLLAEIDMAFSEANEEDVDEISPIAADARTDALLLLLADSSAGKANAVGDDAFEVVREENDVLENELPIHESFDAALALLG
jgi:pimeloyl-ACP methyl ester carboxylesterase